MSAASVARTASTYLAMVGLPALGLVWVIRSGASLEAPPVVAGTWEVAPHPASSCIGFEAGQELSIEQSGLYLRVHAGGASVDGRIAEGRIHAELPAPPGGSCGGQPLSLTGAVAENAITWDVRAPGCDACPSTRFDVRRSAE